MQQVGHPIVFVQLTNGVFDIEVCARSSSKLKRPLFFVELLWDVPEMEHLFITTPTVSGTSCFASILQCVRVCSVRVVSFGTASRTVG